MTKRQFKKMMNKFYNKEQGLTLYSILLIIAVMFGLTLLKLVVTPIVTDFVTNIIYDNGEWNMFIAVVSWIALIVEVLFVLVTFSFKVEGLNTRDDDKVFIVSSILLVVLVVTMYIDNRLYVEVECVNQQVTDVEGGYTIACGNGDVINIDELSEINPEGLYDKNSVGYVEYTETPEYVINEINNKGE